MTRSRTWLICGMILSCGAVSGGKVWAEEWMFRRSYYSHAYGPWDAGRESPWSRSAYRPPFAGAHPHFAIRGGWRINNYFIQNGGSIDRTYIRENWADINY